MLGALIARLTTLRAMSRGVALRLQQGEDPGTEAVIVKQLGTAFEKHLFAAVRNIIATRQECEMPAELLSLRDEIQLRLPSNSLRGGATDRKSKRLNSSH